MNAPAVLAWLVILVGIPLNVGVAVLLLRKYRKAPHLRVLRERFVAELAVLLVVVVFGLIFANNDTLPPPLDTDATKLITRAAVLIIAIVPATYWLLLYRRSK